MSQVQKTEDPKKTNWDKVDPELTYTGNTITLPALPNKMPLREAIKALQRKAEDEEQIMNTVEIIDAYPADGAVAFIKAMKQRYGWASPIPTPGFFGPTPPQLRTIKTGPNKEDFVQVPWGQFKLPGVENPVSSGATMKDGLPVFIIHGQIRKREQYILQELADLTREILAKSSIYKGKAIRLKVTEDGQLDRNSDPDFLPTDYINVGELILNPGEREQVETNVWTPIRHTQLCVEHKIPLKRGVLLSGPYGCGKTMIGNVTAQIAVQHGWTYILLDKVDALKDALLFAKRYAPAVIFAEDVERIIEERDEQGNDLINTIDGVLSKNSQVMTVLTTNFVDKIDKAMLRPGRLDAVISVKPPGPESVQKLVRVYARDLLAKDADLTPVGDELAGNIPATIREIVERSKLAMVSRGGHHIEPSDLLISGRGMNEHLSLLAGKPAPQSEFESFGRQFHKLAGGKLANGDGDKLLKDVKEIHEAVGAG